MAGEKILVVDDEAVIKELIGHYLLKDGFQVITAGDGATALELIRREKPDLILLDILLPVLDGIEICQEIRRETDVPVLFVTSKSDTLDVALGLGVGGDDYIKKPFNPIEVTARVKAHLRRYRQLQAARSGKGQQKVLNYPGIRVPGRRALKEDLLKLGSRYAIAMLDIDFFKKFNDTHGHDVGDQVLKLVASIIKSVGGGGKAYRYGGEEFTILFPGKKMGDVIPHLEELRETIAKRPFSLRGKDRPVKKPDEVKPGRKPAKQLHITVSIGVSERNEKHKTADEVIKAADTSLYKAKKNGRNRVSC